MKLTYLSYNDYSDLIIVPAEHNLTTYNHSSALTRYYDVFSTGLPGDAHFYVEEAMRAEGRVLELACGTGRILIPTAEAGVEITGVDLSPAMLELARGKIARLPDEVISRISLIKGDMTSFELDQRYDLITIPGNSFCLLIDTEAQRACLRRVHDHLEQGGRLVFSIFDPNIHIIAEHSGIMCSAVKRLKEITDPESGQRVVVYDARRHDLEAQTIYQEWTFETLDDNGIMVRREYVDLTLRYCHRYEMQYLLELCGFEIEALYGDFQRGAFKHGYQQVWIARKA